MSTTETTMRNGVDTETLFATLDAVKANPDIATFQFRATNRWVSGTHNRSTIHGFYGAGQELTHRQPSIFDADHPAVLVGAGQRADTGRVPPPRPGGLPHRRPREHRRRPRRQPRPVESTVEGDIDLLGILGLSTHVRNGFQHIRVSFRLEGDDPEKLHRIVEQSRHAVGRLRRHHQRRAGDHRRRRRLTPDLRHSPERPKDL